MASRNYWITGLNNEWIRQVNNSWAEKFEVRDVLVGPALVAVAANGGHVANLINTEDAWFALERSGFRVTLQNKYEVAHAVCRKVLERIIAAIGRDNERIELDRMLEAAANQFVLLQEEA